VGEAGGDALGDWVAVGLAVADGEGVGIGSTVKASAAGRASARFEALAPMTTW